MTAPLYIETVTSTNDKIVELAQPNQSFFSIYTFNQTKGRGQYGNSWEIAKNKNIAYSFIIPTSKIHLTGAIFNFYTALLIKSFIAKITDCQTKVKWPNDIILNNKKVGGILIEKKAISNIDHYIVGIGINVLQEDFSNLPKAGSIKTQSGKGFDLHDFSVNLNNYLEKNIFKEKNSEPIIEKYNDSLFKKDEVAVFDIKGIRQNGIIKYVDAEGYLQVLLEKTQKISKFYYKEIAMLY